MYKLLDFLGHGGFGRQMFAPDDGGGAGGGNQRVAKAPDGSFRTDRRPARHPSPAGSGGNGRRRV